MMRRDEILHCSGVERTAPAWYLVLHVATLAPEQLVRLRDQADSAIGRAEGHTLAAAAYQCVREAAMRAIAGYGRFPGLSHVGPPSHYILHLATDPDEAPSVTAAERQVAVDLAAPFAAGDDALAATWRGWLASFAEGEFQAT